MRDLRDARVTYDGERVLVNGRVQDRDPLVQARACAGSLREILERYRGRSVNVRPVVLFPGWYVDRQPHGVGVWVLNPTSFVGFLEHEPAVFSREECRVLVEGLSRYVRDEADR